MRFPACIALIELGEFDGIIIRGEIGKRVYFGYSMTVAKRKYVEEAKNVR